MIDLKLLRECPDDVRAGIAKKRNDCDLDTVLAVDEERRKLIAEVETLRSRQKAANIEMAGLPKGSPEFLEKVKELKIVSAEIKEQDSKLKELDLAWNEHYLSVPNLPDASVPEGSDESGNVEIKQWGDIPEKQSYHIPHYELDWLDRILDFKRGTKVTGAGFPFFVGDGARLARSLVSFFLDQANEAGIQEVAVPYFVNAASATATGQLPDKEGQMYQTVEDELYAIPTAEVPLTNFLRDEILPESDLPIYRCAYSACFRREAGSYGKDVRGLNRVHQFDKVEILKWVKPETSFEELESLREYAESLLQALGLPYRALLMCGGDMGFSQTKQYDLEVWAVGQQKWLEVSSCSNFESFQSRRARIRYRDSETGKNEFVHTLNGSGLAVPRVFVALLENGLQADGSVKLPEALHSYMGKDRIDCS
ncbi:MAG TPA: serine--tRNA ligase [Opitutae bacterium]|nr:serine--tRNA ligase [Opitutaceae bacterium]HCR29414.1 serine--tRNA ligase [Opitutae bacterium]